MDGWTMDDFGNQIKYNSDLVSQAMVATSTYGGFSLWEEYEGLLADHQVDI